MTFTTPLAEAQHYRTELVAGRMTFDELHGRFERLVNEWSSGVIQERGGDREASRLEDAYEEMMFMEREEDRPQLALQLLDDAIATFTRLAAMQPVQ